MPVLNEALMLTVMSVARVSSPPVLFIDNLLKTGEGVPIVLFIVCRLEPVNSEVPVPRFRVIAELLSNVTSDENVFVPAKAGSNAPEDVFTKVTGPL